MPGLSWRRLQPLASAKTILLIGAAVRIFEYVTNRPLMIDESFLALNVIERSPGQLLHQLWFKQAAPLGFLELEKLGVGVFGRSEYALRVFPFLASIAALVLFYQAGKRLLRPVALAFACATFVLLDPLIYYSDTAKQYALDVAAALALYWLCAASLNARLTLGRIAALAGAGVVAVWFSHAAAFVLASVGVVLATAAVRERRLRDASLLVVIAAAWLASFGVEILLSRSNLSRIQQAFGTHGLLLGGTATGGRDWFETATAKLRYLVGLEDTATGFPVLGSLPDGVNEGLTVLLTAMVVVGFVSLLRRRPYTALLLGLTPVFVVIASAFHKYPLVGRTLLFLMPSVALCLGEAIRYLTGFRRPVAMVGAMASAAAIVAIALLPAIHLVERRATEGIRTALGDLGRHSRAGDTLYVSQLAQYGFVYYHLCGCAAFDPATRWPFSLTGGTSGAAPALIPRTTRIVLGVVNLPQGNYRPDVRRLSGRGRVWILISELAREPTRLFLNGLRAHGRELREFGPYGVRGTAASLYLFDLSPGA